MINKKGSQIRVVSNRRDLRDFIFLPARIHAGHSLWVPPIYRNEKRLFDARRNSAYKACDVVLAVAYENGRTCGRIAGIINHRFNDIAGERTARFGFIECINSESTATALLQFVEGWARKAGMNKIIGPMGFTDQDPEGLLVEGFESEPALSSYYNFEYLPELIESVGYAKDVDYVVYRVPLPRKIPEFYERIHARVSRIGKARLVEFRSTREIKRYARPIFGLMNETFSGLYGYVPISDSEMVQLSNNFLPLIDARFLKVVVKNEEVIGFILGIPNMNEGMRAAGGRLFPFGIIRIMSSARRSKRLDLLLGAIDRKYRGLGYDVVLGRAMILAAQAGGFSEIDSHHELETNHKMRMEMERMGGQVYKRYRTYKKYID